MAFIAENLGEMVKTDSFMSLTKSYSSLSREVLQAAAGVIAIEKANRGLDGSTSDGRRVKCRINR